MMTAEILFPKVQNFLETKPAFKKLMSYLSSSAEISIFIDKAFLCTLFKQDDLPKAEMRKAKSPDVALHFSPDAIETLLRSQGDDLGDLVALVAKLYLAGIVRIGIPGPIPRLLFRGYVQVLKSCHSKLLELSKDHGLSNLKILSVIQKLKSQK